MMTETQQQARVWRNLLLPLALLVPAFVAYTILLQVTHAPSAQPLVYHC